MQSRTESAISSAQMQLLLVGDKEDFRYLRELLNRPGDGFLAQDHARSPEEALARLDQTTYDLLLCEFKSGDSDGLRLLHEVRKDGHGGFVQTPNPDEPSVKRTIRYAIDVYC